jgi:hypothetical protein
MQTLQRKSTVRIPLDYYRILGLPVSASEEQLRQAYSDRIVQLPRREYSRAAITSRKQLIEEAYVVLSNPKERSTYDQEYLVNPYQSDQATQSAVAVENRIKDSDELTHSIEITEDELVGALLILQELGEYEQILNLGRPYLTNKNPAPGLDQKQEKSDMSFGSSKDLIKAYTNRPDIILTVALACLELGREEWQQGHYENAAVSLETGKELLSREGLFPNVQGEIQSDLQKLRPYRILELLALPEEKTVERRQGLELLEEVLEQRKGIDGAADDQSGLGIDDFLRFIQQLRHYLTVSEQHRLFEAESKRPSAVAIYLAVYALIARGFSQRQPALIHQAKQMLTKLARRQDVHLEQSLCALLLGQTEEANSALELSHEYEALAFIRENSQDSPDLLPGLCLYGEKWLENEVYPHFRDLKGQQASLKEYFADYEVQSYLEALPTDAQPTNDLTNDWNLVNRHSFSSFQATPKGNRSNGNNGKASQSVNTQIQGVHQHYKDSSVNSTVAPLNNGNGHGNQNGTSRAIANKNSKLNQNGHHNNGVKQNGATASGTGTQRLRKRKRTNGKVNGKGNLDGNPNTVTANKSNKNRSIRLLWLFLGGSASLFLLWLLLSSAFGLIRGLFSPSQALVGEQLTIQLNEPVIKIPDPNTANNTNTQASEAINTLNAKQVIDTWLATKAASLGPRHEMEALDKVLTGSALTQWRLTAEQDKSQNRYRKFSHEVKVEEIEKSESEPNRVQIEATVNELADFYENGLINTQKSYKDRLRVRYDLVQKNGIWLIQSMSVVNTVSMN